MEDIHIGSHISNTPGTVVRPKSMCVPDSRYNKEMRNVCVEQIFSDVHNKNSASGSFLYNPNQQVYDGANDFGLPRSDTCNDAVSIP